ncbi:MAG: 3-oxoacyl-ACP reductase FabG [Peptococcaceae bacterium]|jgi:3-oxoacyl-[acyl-carrier protein] reductase|nr:3-oxoacyl-ACP reductase FabG [Peptococcaceae bacterium]
MAKTVLITGASGGIGLALVEAFGQAGYQVAIHYRANRAAAETARSALAAAGGRAICCQAEISDREQVRAMLADIERRLGEVTHLVNNAGFAQQKLFADITEAEWDRMFAVHVRGAFHCCQAALPAMLRRQRGSILNISSMWGQIGASCEVHYSAAKAALIGLTKALAKELGPSGIRVNCLAPGVIDTAMNSDLTKEALAELAAASPLGRLGAPAEVARLALFLAGQEDGFVTGQVVGINGGLVI